jgi:hypothetical protein
MILLSEILSEESEDSVYTDEEKQQIGIPLNAVSRGGKWYVDDIYAGKVRDGKFVPAKYEEPTDIGIGDDRVALTSIEDTEIEDYPTLRDARKLPNVNLGQYVVGSIAAEEILNARLDEMGHKEYRVDEMDPAAVSDAKLIMSDEYVHDIVSRWQAMSVWHRTPWERQEMFDVVDKFLEENNTTVSENLYRGLHFSTNRRHDKTFIKTILNKMAVGNEIPLPPAGFSANRSTAIAFANIGIPVISVIFILPGKSKPVKGVRVWANTHAGEREVLTKGGNYKILSVVMQEFDDAGKSFNDGGLNSISLMIELEQAESVNEVKLNDDDSKLFAILFGDNMRNTAKNLKHLRKK